MRVVSSGGMISGVGVISAGELKLTAQSGIGEASEACEFISESYEFRDENVSMWLTLLDGSNEVVSSHSILAYISGNKVQLDGDNKLSNGSGWSFVVHEGEFTSVDDLGGLSGTDGEVKQVELVSPLSSRAGNLEAEVKGTGGIYLKEYDAVTLKRVLSQDGDIEVYGVGEVRATHVEAEVSGKIQILSGGDIKVDYIRTGGVDAATGKAGWETDE